MEAKRNYFWDFEYIKDNKEFLMEIITKQDVITIKELPDHDFIKLLQLSERTF